jgi:hypothetical protein
VTTQTLSVFPHLEEPVKNLVEAHKTLQEEPLLLAVYYAPQRNQEDVFLFEVVENFGGGSVDEDRELFEVTYGSTPGFPMGPGQQLRLIMTNPKEFELAAKQGWTLVQELRTAFHDKRARVIFEDGKQGPQLLSLINA